MEALRLNIHDSQGGERGFTLPEVMITVALLGILLAIAVPTWQSVVESRKVDSAANQVASDMRLAHTRATNQLADFEVAFTSGSSSYELRRITAPAWTVSRTLPDGTQAGTTITVSFKADGSAVVTNGSGNTVRVVSSSNAGKYRDIEFNGATSRVKIVP